MLLPGEWSSRISGPERTVRLAPMPYIHTRPRLKPKKSLLGMSLPIKKMWSYLYNVRPKFFCC
ncbi:hypothetical protein EMIT0P44_160104 [Pseudomonas sp. IT-P44]